MNGFKKVLCGLLALLTVVPILVSCGGDTDDPVSEGTSGADTQAADTEAVTGETLRAQAKDDLPSGLDFDGQTITFLYRDIDHIEKYMLIGENNGGDVLFDAVYERNQTVQDRLNVKFEFKKGPDVTLKLSEEIPKYILAGEADWDVLLMSAQFGFTQSLLGYYVDLMDLPYVNVDQPWWWTDYMEEESIDTSKRFLLNGDFTLYALMSATSAYFNKDMFKNKFGEPDELYALVDEGTWTVDKFLEYCAGAYEDVNGDGTRDEDDVYGARHTSIFTAVNYLTLSSGLPMHGRDSDGLPILNIYNDNWIKWTEILDKYVMTDEYSKISKTPNTITTAHYFNNAKSLFSMSMLYDASSFRDTEFEYGIVPFPKYSEDYDYLSSGATPNAEAVMLPITTATSKYDAIGASLEALSAESYRTVTETYYETTLKGKYLGSENDIRMVDTIYKNIGTNFVMVAGVELGKGAISSMFVYVIRDHDANLTSYYEANKVTFDKYMSDMMEKYAELDV